MSRRLVKRGEALAMMPEALHSGPGAIWWDLPTLVPENEECEGIAVVHVRGSLEHHPGFGGDSYDQIVERARCAFATDPAAVVLRIDSPGGVCSGLNETVFALRKMAEGAAIPLVAYVDELAASAAYAIACACSEVYLPPSAITGSIGVISTLFDQVGLDEAMGLNFATLTSGARKADGHPHVAISEAALSAEQRRVDRLARQFFDIVAKARGLSPKKIASYEAGIFLGQEAADAGLADAVLGWDELLSQLQGKNLLVPRGTPAPLSKAQPGTPGTKGSVMTHAALLALVKQTKAALAKETDPKKKASRAASLAAYEAAAEAFKKEKYVKETVEKHSSEESEEEEESAESESEGGESAESEDDEAESKGNETDRKQRKSESEDDDEDDDAPAEKKSASASLAAFARRATGKTGTAAIGALTAKLAAGERALAKVEKIERERAAEKRDASITSALNARRITRHEAKELRGKPAAFVEAFLEMRPKAIVNIDDDTIHVPDPGEAATPTAGLPADLVKQIEMASAAAPDAKSREALKTKMIQEHQKRMASGMNGAGRH